MRNMLVPAVRASGVCMHDDRDSQQQRCMFVCFFDCIHLFHRIRIRFSVSLFKTFPKREFVWMIGGLTEPSCAASLQVCSLAHAASELAARYCIVAAVSSGAFETPVFDDVVVAFPDSL